MEEFLVELTKNIPTTISAIGVIVLGYYQFIGKKKDSDRSYIEKLNKRIDDQNETIMNLNTERMNDSRSVMELTHQVEKMNDKVEDMEKSLALEQKEKNEYKYKYEREVAEKLRVTQENRIMKRDIQELREEIESLKNQLGIANVKNVDY